MLDTSREATAFFFAWAGLYTKRVRQKKTLSPKKMGSLLCSVCLFCFLGGGGDDIC